MMESKLGFRRICARTWAARFHPGSSASGKIMLDRVVAQGRQGLAFRGAQVDEACVERVQAPVRQRAN